ncbi:MAG TPA: HPr(Ser) kinase/phosphatase [Candidatus Ornithomonoglobus merdipullorum]|uniref:HPr kinase/phosphorylase n=1 Tax=Candidatus Ornithomonoglobus merdipullorum TaxID=2840895 RepID=A0A9D1MBM1_9FIRM|nr:HPr(Ser) kinase/phosphatase [Candidatus Ornithomonoglobus merdipullorum]
MENTAKLPLGKIIENFSLEVIYEPKNVDSIFVTKSDINRPGLQMIGFLKFFDSERIQIMGKEEFTFLEQFSTDEREKRLEQYFSQGFPALVIARGLQIFPEMLEYAEAYKVPLLRTELGTSQFMSMIIRYLNEQLAPRKTRHGVLCEIYGEGILIMGESGVGKSEAAIELVKRGHRLVADDAVEIKKISDQTLIGSSPEIIRHFVEVRGIGIIDVKEIFGMGAIKDEQQIDMVIHLEPWEKGKQYDRLGMVDEYTNIMGINVPSLTIPVKLGRNIAVIVEVAAMNNRQKKMGYNAAVELNNRLMHQMEEQLNLQ